MSHEISRRHARAIAKRLIEYADGGTFQTKLENLPWRDSAPISRYPDPQWLKQNRVKPGSKLKSEGSK